MIPPLKYFNKPTLQILSDGKVKSKADITALLIENMNFSNEDLRETTKSGSVLRYQDRISWTLVYLKKAGMIESEGNGLYKITKLGKDLLRKECDKEIIDNHILSKYSSAFDTFQNEWRRKAYKGSK